MSLKTLVVVIFASCVTMALTKPGYGSSSSTNTGLSATKYGSEHGHPEPESRLGGKDSQSYRDGGRYDDHQRHAPGAFDNDDHRQSGGFFAGNGDHDGKRRSGYDNERHAPGAYDNDNHRNGGDYNRERHAPGAYDNDNHRRGGDSNRERHAPGAYDNDNHRRGGSGYGQDSHERHAPGAYDNDNGRDRHSHGGAQAEPRGYGGQGKRY